MFGRGICEKYQSREENFPTSIFSQIQALPCEFEEFLFHVGVFA
jgi:hypothetical protein